MYRLLLIFTMACAVSCQLSVSGKTEVKGNVQSVKQNMQTGLKTSANGLAFEDHYLLNDQNEELVLTDFQPGNVIAIVLTGVKKFTIVNERAFPGMILTVRDERDSVVMQTGNLFESYTNGVSEKDAQTLRASLTIGTPLNEGNYKLEAKFWDTKVKAQLLPGFRFRLYQETNTIKTVQKLFHCHQVNTRYK